MNTQHDLPESTRFLAQINPTKHSWDELNDPNNGIEFPAEPVGTNEIYGMWFLGYLGLAYNLGLVNLLSEYKLSDDMRHPWNSIHTSLSQLDVANPESLHQFNRAIMADLSGHDERIRFIREYIVDQGLMRLREIMERADGHIDLDRSLTAGCVQTGQKVLAFLYPFHLVDSEGNILYD